MSDPSTQDKNELQKILQSIVESTSAVGATAWECDILPYKEVEHFYANDSGPIRFNCSPDDHAELIGNAARTNCPKVAVLRADGLNALDLPAIAVAPLRWNDRLHVLEALLSPNQSKDDHQRSLAAIMKILESTKSDRSVQSSSRILTQENGCTIANDRVSEYCDQIHQVIETKETTYRIVNETRQFLNVDRVSIVKFKNKRSTIVAISGQQSVNRRSNIVTLLERLARRVLPLRKSFFYPDDNDALAPQVEEVLNDYLKISVTRKIAIVPLFELAKVETEHEQDNPKPDKLIGGLIIEHFTDDWNPVTSKPLIQTAARHSANAYSNSLNLESLFLYPVWRMLGKTKFATTVGNLPISISLLIIFLILIACLVLIPREFKVVANGSMVPEQIQYIFAPGKGLVVSIIDEGTTLVSAETDHSAPPIIGNKNIRSQSGIYKLGQIIDSDLETLKTDTNGKIEQLKVRIADRERGFSGGKRGDESDGESLNELNSQLKSRLQALQLVEKRIASLTLTSTRPGKVLTHSTRDKLLGRPVTEGALLLEIGDVDGDWIVELKMSDDRIGHVLNAQRNLQRDLDVTFVLSTDPSKSFRGRIFNVASATEVDTEKGQTVLIKVKIEEAIDKPLLRARAQVIGKIHCGRRSLGYVWFHQIGEFMHKNVWFRIW